MLNATYEEFEECNQTNQSQNMGNGRHDRAERDTARTQRRTEEHRNQEHDDEDRQIPDDGAERDDRDTNKGACRRVAEVLGEGLDEHVRDDENNGHHRREKDLRHEDSPPSRTRNVCRKLLRRFTQSLFLESSNHRPRKPTISNPRVRVPLRVSAGHPTKVFAVVDDEIGE